MNIIQALRALSPRVPMSCAFRFEYDRFQEALMPAATGGQSQPSRLITGATITPLYRLLAKHCRLVVSHAGAFLIMRATCRLFFWPLFRLQLYCLIRHLRWPGRTDFASPPSPPLRRFSPLEMNLLRFNDVVSMSSPIYVASRDEKSLLRWPRTSKRLIYSKQA